jgi:hypothetical protein
MLGHDSGKALRRNTVSRDWLVEYLRAYIVNAPPSVQDDFRRGFIAGYGEGGQKVLKEAVKEARQPEPPPSRETAPESNGTPKQP